MNTVIYLLQHNKTGKKYLGKTRHPEKLGISYLGSGKYWKEHRKKYGWKDVSVLSVSEEFDDKNDLEEFARFLSEDLDIVNSAEYLNEKIETGLDGGFESPSPETIEKIQKNMDREQQAKTLSNTMLDPDWRKEIGDPAVKKRLETQDFIATGKKISATKNDPQWIETVGNEARKRQVTNTDYSIVSRKSADTRLTPEWKNNNKYECPDCGKVIYGAGNYKQHQRGSKCLQKQKKD